ncbi:MAG TPA: acyltransferase, partial [Alcanivorax sp.]|nr:acyltransferase [Alcanivorax sp.]
MRVAVIQQQNTADLDANLARSMDKIREAVAQGAQLVMLQELHRS